MLRRLQAGHLAGNLFAQTPAPPDREDKICEPPQLTNPAQRSEHRQTPQALEPHQHRKGLLKTVSESLAQFINNAAEDIQHQQNCEVLQGHHTVLTDRHQA